MHAPPSATAKPTTDGVLVVLDPEDPAATLRGALSHHVATDAYPHLLIVFPAAEYERRRRARVDAGAPGPYDRRHLADEGRRVARRVGREYLGSEGVDFLTTGAVGRPCDRVKAAVERVGHAQVYVPAPRRTLLRRLLGGADLATKLDRSLPDAVTVVPVDGVDEAAGDEAGSDADADTAVASVARPRDT